jgi:hypothetical protein
MVMHENAYSASITPLQQYMHKRYITWLYTGLKMSFTGPSDKMSDDFEFGSDICMMMSDDHQFSLARK